MAHTLLRAGAECRVGKAQQPGGECITAAIGLAGQQTPGLQLGQHAVHRRFGPAGRGHRFGQVQRTPLRRQNFQQFELAQTGVARKGG